MKEVKDIKNIIEMKDYSKLTKKLEKNNAFDVMKDLHCVQPGCKEPVVEVHPIGMPLCKKHAQKKFWNFVSEAAEKDGIKTDDGQKWFK